MRGNDLPASALVMEQVVNANTQLVNADPNQPIQVYFRITGDKSLVKSAKNSITSAMERGTLHRRMIAQDSRWFDAKMLLNGDSQLVSNDDLTVVVVVCSVVIVVLIVIIVVLVIVIRKAKKSLKTIPLDAVSSSESYSEEYSDYSYTDSVRSD